MPAFFEAIANGKSNRHLLAAWMIEGAGAGAKALFARNGETYELICREDMFPAELASEIRKQVPGTEGILEREEGRVFLEHITEGRKLIICGAGHVALSLIRLGVMLGFLVTVIEDREEFARRAGEAGAHTVICKPFQDALDEIQTDLTTAFVVMTRAHVHDVDCLRRILQKPYVYAGMMGSRSRSTQIRQQLLGEGYEPRKTEQLHMPIGLKIGARTPEEIAVSVIAELIQVMNTADTGEGFPEGMPEELAAIHSSKEETGILAMIVEKSGEAPRRPGTKMLVRKDGTFLGTIGGGYAEAEILKSARAMLQSGSRECGLIKISMKKGAMFCGGEITVFLLPV